MNKRLSLLIKPASDACNMKCSYCFYSDVSSHRKTEAAAACQKKKSCVMNKNVSCAVIEKAAAYAERAHFAFQGGEPTLAGIDFFEYFVSEAEKFFPGRADFSIQTNGLLLDEDFCAFLAEKSFLVGISLDGYEEIHDLYRSDCSGNGSWKRVMAAIDRLRKHGVRYNVLSVVTNQLAKRADKLMRFFQRKIVGAGLCGPRIVRTERSYPRGRRAACCPISGKASLPWYRRDVSCRDHSRKGWLVLPVS